MTLDKLARMTQDEFRSVRVEMTGIKADLQDLRTDVLMEVRRENQKVTRSNDRVVTKLDTVLKEFAAHTHSHRRIDDTLFEHDSRLKQLEGTAKQ